MKYLYVRCRDYTGRTRDIYDIRVLGHNMYIITDPDQVASIFRDNSMISFDGHLKDLLQKFGIRGKALELSWQEFEPNDSRYLPDHLLAPRQKCLIRFTEEVYRQQLLPGKRMDEMCHRFIESISHSLKFVDLTDDNTKTKGTTKTMSLQAICRFPLVDAAIRSLFGRHLHDIDSNITQHMMEFNDNIWMMIFDYPEFLSSKCIVPRSKVKKALQTFIQMPNEKRQEQTWSVDTILQAQEIVGTDLESRSSVLLMMLWA